MKASFDSIRIQEEAALLEYFEGVFNLKTLNKLLNFKADENADQALPFYMRGYYLPIYKEFGGDLYEACRATGSKLGFNESEIEYYVSNDPGFNAASIAAPREKHAHIIILNRGLIERVSPEELSFVIGHEIGHLIYRHAEVQKVFQFVYPKFDNLPPLLQKLYEFWSQLGEISADRIGFLANRDFETSVRALFKLSSGIDEKHFNLSHHNIARIAEKTFDEMKANPAHISASHPANPIRIKALEALNASKLWASVLQGEDPAADKALEAEINDILSVLRKVPFNDRERAELDFLACAGIMIMLADKDANELEQNYLINILSRYIHWPPNYLDEIIKGDPMETMKKAVGWLHENCPWRVRELLRQLFPMVIRDHSLKDAELTTFLGIGTDELKIPLSEVIEVFLDGTRSMFCPLS